MKVDRALSSLLRFDDVTQLHRWNKFRGLCVDYSRKGGIGGNGWGLLRGEIHVAAAVLAINRPWSVVGRPFFSSLA